MKTNLLIILLTFIFLAGCAQNQNNQKKTVAVELSEQEWKEKLSPEQYYTLREKGTEKPFTGEFLFTKDKGVFKCAGCGQALFSDEMKFESECGWPSFDKEIEGGKIIQTDDFSAGMKRTEITCSNCGGHLGHLFDDGPTETGKRYCVNSSSLTFEPLQKKENAKLKTTETITMGGGCFWCIEAIFEELKGVEKVESGYSGGTIENPTYKLVTSGTTHHAEVVQITYNTSIISLAELLEVFFTLHDPTTKNRQGADIGTQYRSIIFYHDDHQKKTVETIISTLNNEKAFEKPIVTEVVPFKKFYKAENYHQEYYELNKEQPYCKVVIKPKMDKLYKIFSDKLKDNAK